MKKLFIVVFVFLFLNDLNAQINQTDSLLSTFITTNFPYESVKTKMCDSEFVGIIYLSFTINKLGKIDTLNFNSLNDTMLIRAFNYTLLNSNLTFSKSFVKMTRKEKIIQPIFYSYSNCLDYGDSNANNLNDNCYIFSKTLQVIGKTNAKMNKSLIKGFSFNKSQYLFKGVMLAPCIINVNPKLNRWMKM